MPKSDPTHVAAVRAQVMDRARGECEAVDHHDDCDGQGTQWAHIFGRQMGGSAIRDCPENTWWANEHCHHEFDNPSGTTPADPNGAWKRRCAMFAWVNVGPMTGDYMRALIAWRSMLLFGRAEDLRVMTAAWKLDTAELDRLYDLWEKVSR